MAMRQRRGRVAVRRMIPPRPATSPWSPLQGDDQFLRRETWGSAATAQPQAIGSRPFRAPGGRRHRGLRLRWTRD